MRKIPDNKFAGTVTVGEKGQIVIPKQLREMFDIHPGDSLLILGDLKRGVAIPPKSRMNLLMESAFGERVESETTEEE